LSSPFPSALGKLNQVVADLIYKITKINCVEQRVRFSWCPTHISIVHNERVNFLAKEASISGEPNDNTITINELIYSLEREYSKREDPSELGVYRQLVGGYYLNNFPEIKFEFVRKISRKKSDCGILIRLISGCVYKNLFI